MMRRAVGRWIRGGVLALPLAWSGGAWAQVPGGTGDVAAPAEEQLDKAKDKVKDESALEPSETEKTSGSEKSADPAATETQPSDIDDQAKEKAKENLDKQAPQYP